MSSAIDNERFRKLLRSYPVKAVELLYDQYSKSLYHVALGLTHNQNASRDIVQDTFLHVWTNRERLSADNERSIEHYLVKVVRNKSISFYKKRRHLNLDVLNLLGRYNSSIESSIETSIIESELIHQIRNLISTFPRRERECLLMKIDDEMSLDEIALKLKVTRKAVERSITSANKRLRNWASDM